MSVSTKKSSILKLPSKIDCQNRQKTQTIGFRLLLNFFWKRIQMKSLLFYAALLILAGIKLFLVSNNEIVALDRPHDQLWYINSAAQIYWKAEYTQMAFVHLPAYPLFIYLFHLTKIPLRLGIEVFYLVSSFYFCFTLTKIGMNKILSLVTFVLIIFHPFSFNLFDHTLAESFYTPMLLLSLGLLIKLLDEFDSNKTTIFSILTGNAFAILWLTRDENILIALLFSALLFSAILLFYLKRIKKETLKQFTTYVFLIPMTCIILATIFVSTCNLFVFGSFSSSDLHSRGYKAAYKALQSIDADTNIRFVPVTTRARELAYEVSPTFKTLKPILENSSNYAFYYTKVTTDIDGEMGAGWFYWILRDAVFQTGSKSSEAADTTYTQIANEINQAFANNTLKKRLVILDFVDPNFLKYIHALPDSLVKILKLFIEPNKFPHEYDQIMPNEVIDRINHLTNRRSVLISKPEYGVLTGWVLNTTDKIQEVKIETVDKKIISSTDVFYNRQDVYNGFSLLLPTLKTTTPVGFTIRINDVFDANEANLIYVFTDQTVVTPILPSSIGNIQKNDETFYTAIDSLTMPSQNTTNSMKTYWQEKIWLVYGKTIQYLSLFAFIFLGILLVRIPKVVNQKLLLVLLLLIVVIASRILLFAVLDTSSWSGAQMRYIFPVIPLYMAILLIIIDLSWKSVKKLHNQNIKEVSAI